MGKTNQKSKRNAGTKSRLFVFFICILVSSVFWFLVTFNNFFTITLSAPVRYINIPEEMLVASQLPKSLSVEVTGSGYDLLSYLIRPELTEVVLDGRNIGFQNTSRGNKSFITTYHGMDYFNLEHSEVKILKVKPDTLFFISLSRSAKKIKVNVPTLISFLPPFGFKDSLKITPDSAIISGAVELLSTIDSISTEVLVLNKLNQSGEYELKLNPPSKELSYEPSVVKVKIQTEKYTETSIDLPVRIINAPSEMTVRPLPEMVKIKYLVGLSKFNDFKSTDFEIVADYNALKNNKLGRVNLTVTNKPVWVSDIKIQTPKVEIIVSKP